MIRLLALLVALLPMPGLAQEHFPALYSATGVAADDVLNVRAEPSASAPIIGAFGPVQSSIEVIAAPTGGWGQVNTGEASGWVSMRFLRRAPGQEWEPGGTLGISPVPLECFGTEPFWSLHLSDGDLMTFTDPFDGDGAPQPGIFSPVWGSASTAKFGFTGSRDDGQAYFTGILSRALCSDGMSDRLYGLSIDLVRETPLGTRLDTGCCRLAP